MHLLYLIVRLTPFVGNSRHFYRSRCFLLSRLSLVRCILSIFLVIIQSLIQFDLQSRVGIVRGITVRIQRQLAFFGSYDDLIALFRIHNLRLALITTGAILRQIRRWTHGCV